MLIAIHCAMRARAAMEIAHSKIAVPGVVSDVSHRGVISYSYAVNGHAYTGKDYDAKRLPIRVGSKLDVWVSSVDPTNAILRNPNDAVIENWLGIGATTAGLIALCCYFLSKRRKPRAGTRGSEPIASGEAPRKDLRS
jgi:hypothetical protein